MCNFSSIFFLMLDKVIQGFGIQCHQYIDDTQHLTLRRPSRQKLCIQLYLGKNITEINCFESIQGYLK